VTNGSAHSATGQQKKTAASDALCNAPEAASRGGKNRLSISAS
jgi:hypothetical protein